MINTFRSLFRKGDINNRNNTITSFPNEHSIQHLKNKVKTNPIIAYMIITKRNYPVIKNKTSY
jgi:hypothetical protein